MGQLDWPRFIYELNVCVCEDGNECNGSDKGFLNPFLGWAKFA